MQHEKYFLEARGDGVDVTREIEERLNTYGVCALGSGTYIVNGLCMPEGSTLSGVGAATRLVLPDAVTDGFAVRMNSYVTVRNLSVVGSSEPITLPETVGTRHGILFSGTATREDWEDQPRHAILEGCFISGFTGGGLTCVDTGYHVRSAMTASSCHIMNCGAGINISHFSEYHEFTAMLCTYNLYGCINNGGNNVFVNCGFNSNEIGFMIDNSDGKAWNNSHGSVVGCTFNHCGNNKGIGILVLGASSGYVFTGCQDFYSKIIVKDSVGIQFHAMNFGRNTDISVSGKYPVFFSNAIFLGEPILSGDGRIIFRDCYTKDGEPFGI